MMRYVLQCVGLLVLAALLVPAVGCAKKGSTVTGDVTYRGERVEAGYITFLPESGEGRAASGPIKGGKYKVEDVPPGKKMVQIVSGDPSKGSRSSPDDPGKVTPPGADGGSKLREDLIPPDAVGNNQIVEIAGKVERHDFSLEEPKRPPMEGPGAPGKGMPGGPKGGFPGGPKGPPQGSFPGGPK
jgi:hypothetical protein